MCHPCELAWSGFETYTYAINDAEIAYLNNRASQGDKMNVKKYASRELRVELIRNWGKECVKHYAGKHTRDAQNSWRLQMQVHVVRNVYKCSK